MRIFSFNPQNTPTSVPGSLEQISAGNALAVWGINASSDIFQLDIASGNFAQVPGQLASISVGIDDTVWGVDASGNIFQYKTIATGTTTTSSFTLVPGQLASISVGSADNVWGLNASDEIFRLTPKTDSFVRVSGSLASISIGADGAVWGINASSEVYRWNPSGTRPGFKREQGKLTSISVGSANNIWGLNISGEILSWNPTTQVFDPVSGPRLVSIAAAALGGPWGTAWGIDPFGNLFALGLPPYATAFQQITDQQVYGSFAQLSVSAVAFGGAVYGLNLGQLGLNVTTNPSPMIQGRFADITVVATDLLSQAAQILPFTASEGFVGSEPTGPFTATGSTGTPIAYTPQPDDTTAAVYVTGRPDYNDASAIGIPVMPPPIPAPTVEYNLYSSTLTGQGFPSSQCSVSVISDVGFLLGGPYSGNIVDGITFNSTCSGNQGESFQIKVQCTTLPSPLCFKIDCETAEVTNEICPT